MNIYGRNRCGKNSLNLVNARSVYKGQIRTIVTAKIFCEK